MAFFKQPTQYLIIGTYKPVQAGSSTPLYVWVSYLTCFKSRFSHLWNICRIIIESNLQNFGESESCGWHIMLILFICIFVYLYIHHVYFSTRDVENCFVICNDFCYIFWCLYWLKQVSQVLWHSLIYQQNT